MIQHKCPICEGKGTIAKPPWFVGGGQAWNRDSHKCPVCSGIGILQKQKTTEGGKNDKR